MTNETHKCLVCEQTSQQVPLVSFEYQGTAYYICPEHLPVLIHRPHELVGRLPGADQLKKGHG